MILLLRSGRAPVRRDHGRGVACGKGIVERVVEQGFAMLDPPDFQLAWIAPHGHDGICSSGDNDTMPLGSYLVSDRVTRR